MQQIQPPSRCTVAYFLGMTVKRLRQEKQLSQQDLATRCELDRSYITLIEKGRKNPTLNIVEKIGSVVADSAAHFMAIVAYDTQKSCARFCEQGGCPLQTGGNQTSDCPTRRMANHSGGPFKSDALYAPGGHVSES